eukprot:492470-Amphidinium_carterae.1
MKPAVVKRLAEILALVPSFKNDAKHASSSAGACDQSPSPTTHPTIPESVPRHAQTEEVPKVLGFTVFQLTGHLTGRLTGRQSATYRAHHWARALCCDHGLTRDLEGQGSYCDVLRCCSLLGCEGSGNVLCFNASACAACAGH